MGALILATPMYIIAFVLSAMFMPPLALLVAGLAVLHVLCSTAAALGYATVGLAGLFRRRERTGNNTPRLRMREWKDIQREQTRRKERGEL